MHHFLFIALCHDWPISKTSRLFWPLKPIFFFLLGSLSRLGQSNVFLSLYVTSSSNFRLTKWLSFNTSACPTNNKY